MRKGLFIFILVNLFTYSVGYGQQLFQGARLSGLANALTALQDVWNISGNPAGFTTIESPIAAIGYENRFMMQEMSIKTGVFGLPYRANYFGIGIQSFGADPYVETTTNMSYGRALGPNFSVGLKFSYHHLAITGYGTAAAYSVELGLQAKVMKELTLAAHIVNPNQTDFGNETQNPLLSTVRFGARYDLSPKTFLASELEKTIAYPLSIKTAVEYGFTEKVFGRAGVATNPFRQYFGVGLALNDFNVDIASSIHPIAGYSPQLSMNYAF